MMIITNFHNSISSITFLETIRAPEPRIINQHFSTKKEQFSNPLHSKTILLGTSAAQLNLRVELISRRCRGEKIPAAM
jgi:hypothetical protein